VAILRCLIADIPQKVLADIVQRVTQQDEKIDVVGQVSDIDDISGILNTQKIDVLIMGMRDDTPYDFCREILDQFPQLLVVGLVNDGRMAVVCLADLGSSQLVNLITNLGNTRLLKNVSGDELI
jgi:DNA-binding NarL/FixJ family response regulator